MVVTTDSLATSADAQVALLKALLRKFVQVAADRRALARRRACGRTGRAAKQRAERAARAEAAALERLIAVVSHGGMAAASTIAPDAAARRQSKGQCHAQQRHS